MLLRYLLLPLSLLYGLAVWIRNLFYDMGVLSSSEMPTGVICIGNLSTGGTGKTPMTEYLVRLLKESFRISTLSRGYRRHTSGFLLADEQSTSFMIGDEPLQFKKKFFDLHVAVDENRRRGIGRLLKQFPELNAVLLDDAFQHRKVKPGLSILLSDYSKMYYDDFLLPSGTLREWRAGKKRADVIVITKCPDNITPVEKRIVQKKVNPEPHQHVFFSHVGYGDPVAAFGNEPFPDPETSWGEVILLTGISNPLPLQDFAEKKSSKIIPFHFPDHHEYTIVELNKVADAYQSSGSSRKFIITTEKDAMRLDKPGLLEVIGKLPVYYIPIETTFGEKEKDEFNHLILDYVNRANQKYRRLH